MSTLDTQVYGYVTPKGIVPLEFADIENQSIEISEHSVVTSTNEPIAVESSADRLVMQGTLNGDANILQLVDSGATVNSIDSRLLKKLNLENSIKRVKIPGGTGFDGRVVPILGIAALTVKYGEKTYQGNFYVFEKLARYPIILGMPFLKATGVATSMYDALCKNFGSKSILLNEPKN